MTIFRCLACRGSFGCGDGFCNISFRQAGGGGGGDANWLFGRARSVGLWRQLFTLICFVGWNGWGRHLVVWARFLCLRGASSNYFSSLFELGSSSLGSKGTWVSVVTLLLGEGGCRTEKSK